MIPLLLQGIILLLILLPRVSYAGCVHSQLYWNQQPGDAIVGGYTLCGLSWPALLEREVARTAIPANVYWIAAFHCYASVALSNVSASSSSNEAVGRALLIVRDSLERACLNVSGWPIDDDRLVVYDSLNTLYWYAASNACAATDDAFANTTARALEQAFYYTATPDLIVVPGQSPPVNGSVAALVYSLLADTYRFRQFTTTSAVLGCLVVSPILICIIACIADKRRRFFSRDKKNKRANGANGGSTRPFLDPDDTHGSSYVELPVRSSSSMSHLSLNESTSSVV